MNIRLRMKASLSWLPCQGVLLFLAAQTAAMPAEPYIGIDACTLPLNYGSCTEYVHKWYYNSAAGKCQVFAYGGCQGNANRYDSEEQCLLSCHPPPASVSGALQCEQPLDIGYCQDYAKLWYFDRETKACAEFIFGGCGGNENRFITHDQCQEQCMLPHNDIYDAWEWCQDFMPKPAAKQILKSPPTPEPLEENETPRFCFLPLETGTCTSYVHKWGFDASMGACRTFAYGGCQGNRNRFDTEAECQNLCISSRYTMQPFILSKYGITRSPPVEDPCGLPADFGGCQDFQRKWYFDNSEGECVAFLYGGCLGNANRFDTEAACMHKCLPASIIETTPTPEDEIIEEPISRCAKPMSHGACNSYVHKWYFSNETGRCDVFVYGGCRGNSNRFSSELTCWKTCVDANATDVPVEPTAVSPGAVDPKRYLRQEETQESKNARLEGCKMMPYRGACKSYVHKWFYNMTNGQCETFVYGGCMGNRNRFDSYVECMHFCVGGENYTLPPYLRQQYLEMSQDNLLGAAIIRKENFSVPMDERGEKLTFRDTGFEKTFMFARTNAFIQLDSNQIPTFQLRLCREISFEFRTKLPHGLLVYHGIKDRPEQLSPYALYVIVEKGQLKVVHVFGKHSTSVIVGEGLNRDTWHKVTVRIDVHQGRLFAKVNNQSAETPIKGLSPTDSYGVTEDLPSVVLIGGLSPEEKLHGVKYIIESFVGCIRGVVLSAGKAARELLPIKPLVASKHENVKEGCIDICRTKANLCFVGSRCVNHYNSLSCDCFGTRYEGEQCDVYTATSLTLRGSSYVSYRVYDWRDRVHSSENRISLFFMTHYDDSALFYASGEWAGTQHHIAASILNGSVVLDIDFGDGPVITSLGSKVNLNSWNNLTILHRGPEIFVSLNHDAKLLDAPGDHHYIYIDPEIYIGGGPELTKKKGLVSHNNFAGTLKYVFFNDISIIYELKKGNPKVHYIGVLEPEFYETDVEVIPITLPFPSSHVWWENKAKNSMNISFHFKNARNMGVLAYSEVTTASGKGYWVIRTVSEEVRVELVPDNNKNVTHLSSVKFDPRSAWHTVELKYSSGQLRLIVDQKEKSSQLYGLNFELSDRFLIGGGAEKTSVGAGLVGCMRLIYINGQYLEPRYVVRTHHAVGDLSLDNCQLVDPCKRPDACEHGGKCSMDVDKVVCDCDGTGYTGKNCHFAEFRKTCEELALLGYNKPDVYLIDIDGNGRFPPAHVKCEFPSAEDSTKTIVEHNLPREVDVRSSSESDFSFSIKYREFSAEMLQELISHSLYCTQHIKYDCYKAPLDLHSATWFISSARNKTVDYIGNVKRGTCPCGVNRTCVNPQQSCNCDISEAKWHSDEGFFETPQSLGITDMVFLQQKDLAADALGRITLGPLECVETNTQKYVVTFTTSQSYIEVPGWRKGDIAFSFRTTGEKAILLYQPPIRPSYPSFMVALTSDFQLTFNFTLNTGRSRELEIKSRRKLNGGEWQKIWIDYNEHHVRFMINTDYQMVDLLPEEEFGPFEGSMFIGGATEDLLKKSSVTQGLIGCFRGLVVNGEILDIYSYMSVHLSEIIKDCKPTCDPNPCKNGAMCRELWSKYECVCENPWAHIGDHCETNINTQALTFLKEEAFLKKNYIRNVPDEEKEVLQNLAKEDVLVNMRTYDKDAMILYMNDHLNNFIHLYVHDNKFVTFLFNDANEIKTLEVEYPGVGSGKSVQVAVIRTIGKITLHVNDKNVTIPCNHRSILSYSNRPWINPEKEVLAPQRPPAPPTEYYQINLGGYDHLNLRKMKPIPLPGYVGCIRGLKLGRYLVDLEKQLKSSEIEAGGVTAGCRMKCDEEPCKHHGICTEDFVKGESTCNCELTSYYGESCNEEKGADFSGESQLQRQFVLPGEVHSVRAQLAFSSSDNRQRKVVLLLLQTENKRSYYLLVGLTPEGHLIIEEDRENSVAYGAKLTDQSYLDGARHSIYYQRNGSSAILLIDRKEVPLGPVTVLSMSEFPEAVGGTNEVQIGGLNTTDPRFSSYRSYSGCLSNVLVEVNGHEMKPLEEYMLFTKAGSEKIDVRNSAGIRSAQCAEFTKHMTGPSLNISSLSINLGTDKGWVEDPPVRTAYKSLYSDSSTEEEGIGKIVLIVLSSIFVVVILSALYMLWNADRQYRRRKKLAVSASRLWGSSHVSFSEPSVTVVSYKKVSTTKAPRNGLERKSSNGYAPVPTAAPEGDAPQVPNGHVIAAPEEPDVESIQEKKGFRESEEDLLALEEANTASTAEGEKNEEASQPAGDQEVAEESEKASDEKVELNGYHKPKTKFPPIPEEMAFSKELMAMGFRVGAGELARSNLPPVVSPGPVFISQQRTFSNPVSYLGGPRLPPKPQGSSLESLISVD